MAIKIIKKYFLLIAGIGIAGMIFWFSSHYNDSCSTVTDLDGNVYKTISIDTSIWMAENLKVNHYRNGDIIPNITVNEKWEALITGACCYYNNDSLLGHDYGKLYNWFAVNDLRGICPTGWHVPSKAEFQSLIDKFGGVMEAGGQLKSKKLWNPSETANTDSSQFSVIPSGYRTYTGNFKDRGVYGSLWTATEGNTDFAWLIYMAYNIPEANIFYVGKKTGMPCRCVKD